MRPVLEFSGSVWDPSGVGLQNEIEKVQNRAARFVTGNYNFETGSMTGILEHLKWESVFCLVNSAFIGTPSYDEVKV